MLFCLYGIPFSVGVESDRDVKYMQYIFSSDNILYPFLSFNSYSNVPMPLTSITSVNPVILLLCAGNTFLMKSSIEMTTMSDAPL